MTIRNSLRNPILNPTYGPLSGRSGATLTQQVADLFAGTPGVMLDMSVPTLMFQNSNGTGAVSDATDPIGYVTDLSGNDNHATAYPDSDARAAFGSTPSAVFAGASCLATPSIDFSGTDKLTVIESFRLSATGSARNVSESSANFNSNNGSFRTATGTTGGVTTAARGTAVGSLTTGAISAPYDRVITAEYDIAQTDLADEISFRLNAVEPSVTPAFGPLGTGNFGDHPIYFGARAGASFFLDGAIYRAFVIGRAITTEERDLVEAWAGVPANLFF